MPQCILAGLYYEGEGVPQDYAEAAKWYRKAAEQGHDEAQYKLGSMYDRGEGVTQDFAEAIKWYRRSAEQGNSNSQFHLGLEYYLGTKIPTNYFVNT